jgi:signal transduction histidine kinase
VSVKIGQRLALRFALVSALLTGAILIFIYILTQGFLNADFVDRLTQQSSLEVLHYASPEVKDVLPSGSFSLINPSVSIYLEDRTLLHKQGNYVIPDTWLNYLAGNTIFNAEREGYTTVGRKYVIEGKLYLVYVSDKDLPGEKELDFLLNAIVAGWIISLILSYTAGMHFASKALQPVTHVVQEVNQITEDKLDYRLAVETSIKPDEIGELILTFNALLSRIQKAFIAQKRFVQNASHELKTPLTSIIAEVELALARDRSKEEYQRVLQVVIQEAERLASITQELLTLARLEEGISEKENVNVHELWQQTFYAFNIRHPDRAILQIEENPEAYIYGSKLLLQTCLLNLLDNACKYSSDKITVNLTYNLKEVTIKIEDRGIGIPHNELHRIRTPLFRANNAFLIPGAGLGLTLVERIVAVHKGKLEITSIEGQGTTCTVVLPLFQYT